MASHLQTTGRVAAGLLVLPLSVLALAAWMNGEAVDPTSSVKELSEPPPPANTEDAVTFMRAGLDARDLAAAGVTASDVTSLANGALGVIGADPGALDAADNAYAAARSACDALERKVQSGLGSPSDVAQCRTLETQRDDALAARDALLTSIFDTASATLDSSTRTALETIRSNAASWDMPEEFLVKTRTEREWLDLRDALATERINANYGEDFPDEVQSYLAAERADPAVAQAIQDIAANYAAVQTAWNAAVSN